MASANEHLISATELSTITPGATDLPDHKGIWVGTGGNLTVTLLNGNSVVITGVTSGTLLPVRVRRVTAATAGSLLLWS